MSDIAFKSEFFVQINLPSNQVLLISRLKEMNACFVVAMLRSKLFKLLHSKI